MITMAIAVVHSNDNRLRERRRLRGPQLLPQRPSGISEIAIISITITVLTIIKCINIYTLIIIVIIIIISSSINDNDDNSTNANTYYRSPPRQVRGQQDAHRCPQGRLPKYTLIII